MTTILIKASCVHGHFEPHEEGAEYDLRCAHWPGKHVASCGSEAWRKVKPGVPCNGGGMASDAQLLEELRHRGVLSFQDDGNHDRLVTKWSGYHQDKT